jgi:hypothetical protein
VGKRNKARILAYCVDRQAWQNPGSGAQTVLCKMSTGEIVCEAWHPGEYFGMHEHLRGAEVLPRHEFRDRYKYTAP